MVTDETDQADKGVSGTPTACNADDANDADRSDRPSELRTGTSPDDLFATPSGWLLSPPRARPKQHQKQQPGRGRSRIVGSIGDSAAAKRLDSNAHSPDPMIRDHPISGS